KTPPAVHSHCRSTCPAPASRQTAPGSAPGPASSPAGSHTPALPAECTRTATRTASPHSRQLSFPEAPPAAPAYVRSASHPLPQSQLQEPATQLSPPAASPAARWPAPASAADCSETSPRRSCRRYTASGDSAPLPASSLYVGPPATTQSPLDNWCPSAPAHHSRPHHHAPPCHPEERSDEGPAFS